MEEERSLGKEILPNKDEAGVGCPFICCTGRHTKMAVGFQYPQIGYYTCDARAYHFSHSLQYSTF
jgi:hypothetical protein